ncbi:MAG: hypothetical protein M3Y39_20255 [Chloroflexota bacterium]|nr:hypothetical protein [Chloroflexota bacterium]
MPHHTDWPPTLVFGIMGILSLLGLVATIGFAVLMYTRVRQQITLTEDGLMQVGLSSKVRSIPWSEARLFAILGIYGAKKYPSRRSSSFPAVMRSSVGTGYARIV